MSFGGMTPVSLTMDTPAPTLHSPSPLKDRVTPYSGSSRARFGASPGNENSNTANALSPNALSPVPQGMDIGFYQQDFSQAEAGRLVTEIEGRQAGDPHGTTAAYRHLVKVLVKRMGAKPDTLSVKTAEKRQVERALDNARLEVESQQNTITHLKTELGERREHERLNQHSISLLDCKLGEKVREALFTSNELDALRRHNQALVDTKTGLDSQLETCHARLVERSTYVVELEAKNDDLAAKLQQERKARHEEASAAASEHSKDQEQVADLTAAIDGLRRMMSGTQTQLDEWDASDSKVATSAQLDALVKAAQDEAAAAVASAAASEAKAAAAVAASVVKPSMETVLLLAVAAWPLLLTLLVCLAYSAYGSAHPGTAQAAFQASAEQAFEASVAAAEAVARAASGAAEAMAEAVAGEEAAEFEASMAAEGPGLFAKAVLEEAVGAAAGAMAGGTAD